MVIGFITMPDSYFLTRRTCSAWASGSRLRWMTPRPPFWAMAMAMRASVTVSMAEAMIGMLRRMVLVSLVATSTSLGRTSEQHVIEGQAIDDLIGENRGHDQLL